MKENWGIFRGVKIQQKYRPRDVKCSWRSPQSCNWTDGSIWWFICSLSSGSPRHNGDTYRKTLICCLCSPEGSRSHHIININSLIKAVRTVQANKIHITQISAGWRTSSSAGWWQNRIWEAPTPSASAVAKIKQSKQKNKRLNFWNNTYFWMHLSSFA